LVMIPRTIRQQQLKLFLTYLLDFRKGFL